MTSRTALDKPMARRLLLGLFDGVGLLLVAVLVSPAFYERAWGYVDPSVMTYTIQAVAGIAVALSAVASVAFRRTRKALVRMLNIDENAHKEVDNPWVRMEANENALYEQATAVDGGVTPSTRRTRSAMKTDENRYAPKWGKRILLSFVVTLFCVSTILVVAPYEIIAGSEGSLVFGLDVLWKPILLFAAIVFAISFIVLSILRGRAFILALMLAFCVGVCCYIQAMFLNGGLSFANGSTIDWNEYRLKAIWTFGIWVVLIVVPMVLAWRWPDKLQIVAACVSVFLIIVQGVAVASIFAEKGAQGVNDPNDQVAGSYVMTQHGMYTVSPNENVIVFVLDTYDTQFLIDALAEDPTMLDAFTGFTWFDDSVGSLIPTRYGIPFLLTGERPHYDETFQTFLANRYQRSDYLETIYDLGYSIGIYTDTLGEEYLTPQEKRQLIYDKTINIKATLHPKVNEVGAVKGLVKCAIYRDIFWFGKPFFWFYTDEINRMMAEYESEEDLADAPYVMDDAAWFVNLKKFGVTLDENDEKAFRFIHLNGTHWPYNISEDGDDIGLGNATRNQQAIGSMTMVAYYLEQMKELGVYDNATIIITADHGDYYPIYDYLEEPTCPYMLVKPAQSAELDEQPVVRSSAPVVAEDVLATVVDAMGGDGSSYGIPMFEIEEGIDRPRYYSMTINDENKYDDVIAEYEIDGHALDLDNWHLTGQEWIAWE